MVTEDVFYHRRSWERLEWFISGVLYHLRHSAIVDMTSPEQLTNTDISKTVATIITDAFYRNSITKPRIDKNDVLKTVEAGIQNWISYARMFRSSQIRGPGETPLTDYVAYSIRKNANILNPKFQDLED